VREKLGADGRKVAAGIENVEEVEGLRAWLETTVLNHLDPATLSHTISAIDTGKGTVLAVNVEPSLHLVAVWNKADRRVIEYLYRTNQNKAWMNPGEVERHLMNSSRAMSLRLKEVFDKTNRGQPADLAPGIHGPRTEAQARRARATGGDPASPVRLAGCRVEWSGLSDGQLELALHAGGGAPKGTRVALPHGLVREAWITSDGRAGLCLGVRIVLHPESFDTEYELEPL
jgi:hypothetical protein